MTGRTLSLLTILGCTGFLACRGLAGDVVYHLQSLDPLIEGQTGGPEDMNEHTQVVGTTRRTNGIQTGYLLDPVAGLTLIGDLPGGHTGSSAFAVNNLGNVCGVSDSANGVEAFFWSPEGGLVGLGDLPGSSFWSWPEGINDLNQVVGTAKPGDASVEAFLWNADNGMIGLGDLPGGEVNSRAFDINNAGLVVGDSVSERAYFGEAFLWDAVNGMRGLGDLPGGGFAESGRAINEIGQITGYAATPERREAFLWDPVEGFTLLGYLPGDYGWTAGYGLNDHGQVVGIARLDVTTYEAFIWDREHGIRPLSELVAPSTDPRYLPLRWGGAINNRGEIMAYAWHVAEAVLLTPFVIADLNCDDAVDENDIDPFFLALGSVEVHAAAYPNCHGDWAGDVNQDGALDAEDIDPFFAMLAEESAGKELAVDTPPAD